MTIRRATIYCVIAAILWSTSGLLIKMVPWGPLTISGIRSGIAAITMLIYWAVKYRRRFPWPDKYIAIASLNYAILVTLFISANKFTSSANAILLQYTSPVWVLLIGRIFYKDDIKRRDLLTVLAVFFGMALFFIGDLDAGGMMGNVFAVLSGISMAILIMHMNKLKGREPIEIVIWGNIFTFIIGIPFYGSITMDISAISGIVFLGVFQIGLAYIFYTAAVRFVTPIEAILLPVIEPLLNPVWVLVILGEKPSIFALIGGIIVIGAVIARNVYYMAKHQKRKAQEG